MGNTTFQKAEFDIFRQRMLLQQLDEVGIREAHAQIMRESDRAAEIATTTPYPLLVFPCLFEERVQEVIQNFHQREAGYWELLRPIADNCEQCVNNI